MPVIFSDKAMPRSLNSYNTFVGLCIEPLQAVRAFGYLFSYSLGTCQVN